ncbi:uridine kinase [Legionella brunensis]|nr:uridine kinase [Legionella brunensis]
MKTHIVGISGASGAGKTTLTAALAQALEATSLSWDEFDKLGTGPEDYVEWDVRGRNYAEWSYATLAKTLQMLKANKTVAHPVSGVLLHATKYIVFDAPLGRLHQQTGAYIDICIHIEVPLDVSLARRIIRDFESADCSKEDLLAELNFYLKHARKLFFDEELKDTADIVLSGLLSTPMQLRKCLDYLQKKSIAHKN